MERKITKGEEMAMLLRKQKQRELLPSEDFILKIEEEERNFIEGKELIKKCIEEPKLIFTEAREILGSPRHLVFESVGRMRHDFQYFLASIANNYFQEWLEEQNIEDKAEVEVRNPNSYPSIFVVYFNDEEVIQFDIFKKSYGMREKRFTEEELLQKHTKNKLRIQSEIEKEKVKLEEIIDMKANPKKYVKFWSDYYLIWFRRKKLKKSFDRRIKFQKKDLKFYEDELSRAEETYFYQLEKNKRMEKAINKIEPFFEKLGYEKSTEQHLLY